ncbi:MAG: recombination protein O N-terminal domain-containing protein [Patescibacteria group bacterium]|nr:recombination protein O N-terminal domain-containing protein [Patescibacteria group bacterium]
MYTINVTEGIVLEKRPLGEESAQVAILTERFGLLRATAQAGRGERSKLRYGLEPLTLGRYSFVRGKKAWRLSGAEHAQSIGSAERARRTAAGRICKLLLRLVHGEETSGLYTIVREGLNALVAETREPIGDGKAWPSGLERRPSSAHMAEHVSAIEIVLVLRILATLGYLPHSEALTPFVDGAFSVELSAQALEHRALLIRTINESLHATGL